LGGAWGKTVARIVAVEGGTVVLSETPDLIGLGNELEVINIWVDYTL
jgi:hypothetical protein